MVDANVINKTLLISVCLGMASALVLGMALADQIENKTLPLTLTITQTQYTSGAPVHILVKNVGSYPITFSNSVLGVYVTDSENVRVWDMTNDGKSVVLGPKEEKTLVWETVGVDVGVYDVWLRVSTIIISTQVEVV